MNEETGFIAAVLRDLATSTAVILAAWGALGGACNALTTRMRLRDALRHILLGGLIAAGTSDHKERGECQRQGRYVTGLHCHSPCVTGARAVSRSSCAWAMW